jgi:MerR family mercuric resistance operon transcriptional regulator
MWSIGKLAQSTGCNIETIRYYERVGLLPKPPRSEGGHRLYDEVHRGRLVSIRRGRDLGFTLKQIQELMGLSQEQEHPCQQALTIAERHLALVEEKLADLRRVRESLAQMAQSCRSGCACTKAPKCSILEILTAEEPEPTPSSADASLNASCAAPSPTTAPLAVANKIEPSQARSCCSPKGV